MHGQVRTGVALDPHMRAECRPVVFQEGLLNITTITPGWGGRSKLGRIQKFRNLYKGLQSPLRAKDPTAREGVA